MNKKVLSLAAIAAISATMLATPASAAPTAGTVSWGYWGEGNLSFPDATGTIAGTWTVTSEGGVTGYNSDDDGEYYVASTPIGSIFGATPSTGLLAGYNYIKVETLNNTSADANVSIDFDSEVPASRIGLVIGDIDTDHVTITMKDGSGNDLTADQIKGTATTRTFNYCTYTPKASVCGSDTDVPVESSAATSVTATGSASGTDGSSYWVRPSAGVKSIRIAIRNDDNAASSTERIWIVQSNTDLVDSTPGETLAETGTDSTPLLWIASLSLLLAGAAARRFATKRN